MSPLVRGLIAIVLIVLGTSVWIGFTGAWTLSGLALNVAGGLMLGRIFAEAEGYK